jgi:hypothetical protein
MRSGQVTVASEGQRKERTGELLLASGQTGWEAQAGGEVRCCEISCWKVSCNKEQT